MSPVVNGTIWNADGSVAVGVPVKITLLAGVGSSQLLFNTTDSVEVAPNVWSLATNASGQWTITLKPNSFFTPANTVYQVQEANAASYFIIVPNGAGPYWVGNILAAPPTAAGGPYISSALLGVPNGVATLDAAGKGLLSQEPIGPGFELGRVVSTTPFTITASLSLYSGLSLPVVVPVGCNVEVDALFPAINMGVVATTVVAEIWRDGNQVGAAITSIPASAIGDLEVTLPETPPAGNHLYEVKIGLGAASATTVSQAGTGVFGLYNIFPFLRVVAA
jgi:hypothetical protein